MGLTTKLCGTVISMGARSLTSCSGALQTLGARNFHLMIRPIAASGTIATSTLTSLTSVIPTATKLLQPVNSILNQVAGFKVKGRLRRRCKDCYLVIREARHYIICPTHPRHKQMSMKKRDYKSWILTHATQSKVRPY